MLLRMGVSRTISINSTIFIKRDIWCMGIHGRKSWVSTEMRFWSSSPCTSAMTNRATIEHTQARPHRATRSTVAAAGTTTGTGTQRALPYSSVLLWYTWGNHQPALRVECENSMYHIWDPCYHMWYYIIYRVVTATILLLVCPCKVRVGSFLPCVCRTFI